jgi:hypothetical protein
MAEAPWYETMFNSGVDSFNKAQDMTASGGKQGQAGGKKQPDLVADAPAPIAPRQRPAYDASRGNTQIAAILQSLFGAQA